MIDDLGGAKVRLARRNNIVRIEAMLPELAESVNWTVQLSNRDLGNEFIPPSAYSLIEGLILDYRVALNGRL